MGTIERDRTHLKLQSLQNGSKFNFSKSTFGSTTQGNALAPQNVGRTNKI
jgi:hypothetical protein